MLKRYLDSKPHIFRIILPLTILLFLSGGSLVYWKSSSVLLTADGHTRRVFTSAHTIKEFLEKERITMNPSDFTVPPLDSPIGHNTAVKLTRVTMETVIQISSGTPVITWQTRNRENLRSARAQKGYKTRDQVSKSRSRGSSSVEISRATAAGIQILSCAFFTLVLFNKAGQPTKSYNLLQCKVLKMRSTGYFVGEKTVPSDVTFTGHKLQHGLVAVDPKVIPLGSRLYVSGYGYAYAADTGSAIKGLRIDLAVKDKYEEARYNRHNVPVYILEKATKW